MNQIDAKRQVETRLIITNQEIIAYLESIPETDWNDRLNEANEIGIKAIRIAKHYVVEGHCSAKRLKYVLRITF